MNQGTEGSALMALPRYQSHKKVWALKIKSVALDSEAAKAEGRGSATITQEAAA